MTGEVSRQSALESGSDRNQHHDPTFREKCSSFFQAKGSSCKALLSYVFAIRSISLQLLFHHSGGHASPGVAVRLLIEERFSDTTNESELGSFGQFQRNTTVRLVLLWCFRLFWGLSKCTGCKKFPWAKTWASMFWRSFFVQGASASSRGRKGLAQIDGNQATT